MVACAVSRKIRKGATQDTKMRGQTSHVVRPRAELHRGYRVRPISQTRNLISPHRLCILSAVGADATKRCGLVITPPQDGMFHHLMTEKYAKTMHNATSQAWATENKKKVRQEHQKHGQTSDDDAVTPQAELHRGCRVSHVSQTRNTSTCLRRAPRARVSPTYSHLCSLQNHGQSVQAGSCCSFVSFSFGRLQGAP